MASRGFSYKPKSLDLIKKKATGQRSQFARMLKDTYLTYMSQQGVNKVRLLPANEEYWGYPIQVHWIGDDNFTRAYACPRQMKAMPCPVCEERSRLYDENDQDGAKALNTSERLLVWIINRDDQEKGPMLWDMPKTLEIDMNGGAVDDEAESVLPLDDPIEGYDLRFNREGKGTTTRYQAFTVARRSSPLTDDEEELEKWLDYVEANPLEQCVTLYEYDHIKAVFEGKDPSLIGIKSADDDQGDEAPDDDPDDSPSDLPVDDEKAGAGDAEEPDDETSEADTQRNATAARLRERLAKRSRKA